ncbi:hypothetical protein MVEN_00729100 [Mycena venus]|uniref:Carbohydrate-binding module family 67 protein n=1 Tax=Mycena venus TaxID=2733690 RepID=A0A8H6YF52_9AGAR|nr:hypothetical protein MVEN_00729100 [Mycena venus]
MAPLFRFALLSVLLAPLTYAAGANNATDSGLAPAVTSPLNFASSKWIWTSTTTTNALVALRKGFTPPLGKSLIAAEILITADNSFNLYVNGDYVGSGTPPAHGTTDTLLTDSSWRVKQGLPAGFESLSFDDTAWPVATVAGTYGAAPWDIVLIPSDPPVVGFDHAQWIWTDIVPASGKVPASATIILTADNSYTLYVNGVTVGSGGGIKTAQRYTVNFATPASEVVLAVLATNTAASVAGVIANMEINMVPSGRASCTAGAFLLTDAGWKSTKGAIPTGFEQPGFDDSAWPAVVAEETYAAGPNWGALTIQAVSPPVTV